MKKTIWIPIVGGFLLGVLSFLISVANITFQVSQDLILGPWEIFNTISAMLFGPIGFLITQLGMDLGGYLYLLKEVSAGSQNKNFVLCDYVAHSASLMIIAFGYSYIYRRMKMPKLLVGWSLALGIYYIVLAILQVFLYNIFIPDLEASYAFYFSNIPVELILIIVITSLILLALPERYCRPQWYESKSGIPPI